MVRLVRDLSLKVGKEVDLRLEGEDTEIDRSMVEAIYDPLVHLVRNSVDHGLETPEQRQGRGKPPSGHLFCGPSTRGATSSSKSRTTAGDSTGRPSWPKPSTGAWWPRDRP